MSFVLSPNMNLPIPGVGTEAGPQYAFDINSALTLIDQHNHTPGYGEQIPSAGLNINSALTFNNQQAIDLQATVFTPQSSVSTLNALYVSGIDLYFNDGNGDPAIQITKNGAVNATSSGIVSGTASAGFVTGVLVVDSAPNTPADIQVGSVLLGNTVALSNFLTLSPPAAMASNFTITLPNLPASTSFLTIDTSGNVADNVSLTAGITRSMQAAVGQQISSSCGTYTVTGDGSYHNITNLTVTLTTSGRPVMLMLIPDGGINDANLQYQQTAGANNIIRIDRDSSAADYLFGLNMINVSGTGTPYIVVPPSIISTMDVVSAGTHTYIVAVKPNNGFIFNANNIKLLAYEL